MTPTEFAVKRLKMRPYRWQAQAMEAVAMEIPVSLVAANGSGKTANVIAPLVQWCLHEYPRAQVVITSGSFRQIEKQLFPAIRVHAHKFPHWKVLTTEIKTPQEGFAFGFSTDNPGRAEGWHPKIDNDTDPVFIIVDEAKTVPDSIFEAFDRCTRRFELHVSSPGAPAGEFFRECTTQKKGRYVMKVTSMDCPHINPAKREKDKEKHGEDSPIYRSMHLAEFTEDEERLIITPTRLAYAIDNQPQDDSRGEVVAFCDFAAGGDENVLWERRGNRTRIIRAWREKDTIQASREFVRLFREHGLTGGDIWGDSDGLGTVMIDAIAECGVYINRFHGGQAAKDSDNYANLISEVWIQGIREIERGRVNIGELDPVTSKQLTDRFSEWTSTGKLRVEPKDKMKARGVASPDRADALLGAIMCGSSMSGALTAHRVENSVTGGNDFGVGHVEF